VRVRDPPWVMNEYSTAYMGASPQDLKREEGLGELADLSGKWTLASLSALVSASVCSCSRGQPITWSCRNCRVIHGKEKVTVDP